MNDPKASESAPMFTRVRCCKCNAETLVGTPAFARLRVETPRARFLCPLCVARVRAGLRAIFSGR